MLITERGTNLMKDTWLKIVVIALAVALVFTIVTSNIVSITAISTLKKAKLGNLVVTDDTTNNTNAADDTTAAPVDSADSETQPVDTTPDTTGSGGNNTATTNAPSGSNNTTAKPTGSMPSTKAEVFDFYKAAVNKIKSQGAAGHTRKEWQTIDSLSFGGKENTALLGLIQGFVTSEEEAVETVSAKGSKETKDNMAPCGAPIDKVLSATCTPSGNNYKIKIVMKEETNPEKGSNGIASMATGILFLEDVKNTIANDSKVKILVKSLDDSSKIVYKAYTITATLTKDGKFIDMQHIVTGEIEAGAKLIFGSINGAGALTFHSNWYNFKY